ncbi:MAG: hypothetical protein FWE45_01560 [Firmicutes bacterium]|nr:hypothetical protein [Bacillota bacterium]
MEVKESFGDILHDAKEFIGDKFESARFWIGDKFDDACYWVKNDVGDWISDKIVDGLGASFNAVVNGYDRVITNTKRSKVKSEMRKILRCCKKFSKEDYKEACERLNEALLNSTPVEETVNTYSSRIPQGQEASPDYWDNTSILIRDSNNSW